MNFQSSDATATNYAYSAYTKTSWDAFTSAYVYARAVMNNNAATQDQLRNKATGAPISYRAIAAETGVSVQTVINIKNRLV